MVWGQDPTIKDHGVEIFSIRRQDIPQNQTGLEQNISDVSITVFCNSIKALKKSMDANTQLSCLLNHSDIILNVDRKLQEITLLASLNVEYKNEAKHWWNIYQETRNAPQQHNSMQR